MKSCMYIIFHTYVDDCGITIANAHRHFQFLWIIIFTIIFIFNLESLGFIEIQAYLPDFCNVVFFISVFLYTLSCLWKCEQCMCR